MSRLDKAKHQFEALLQHASEFVVDSSDAGTMKFKPEVFPPSGVQYQPHVHRQAPTHSLLKDKDGEKDMVLTLQDEIDRLKDKLNRVIAAAEQSCEDFQAGEAEMRSFYEQREINFQSKIEALERDNSELRVALEASRETVSIEKQQLLKALRTIDRLNIHSKDIHTNSFLSSAVKRKVIPQNHHHL